jgi:UDP-N-acetylmuramoylalanine--D-glutamate ligase
MDKLNVAVLGLGIEGKNAVKSLLDYGNHVYASDLNNDIRLSDFNQEGLDIDLGLHDTAKIDSADAVVLSPGLWKTDIAKRLIKSNKLLSDIVTAHKSIFTIAVTGTNGKTTTCYMLNDILKKSGLNVLLGGNAGGGFEGYTKLILEASDKYDVMIVEVCDMTLDYTSYVFTIDMVIVTNIGYDHMGYHKSLENYGKSVCKFLKGKKQVILNGEDQLLIKCANCGVNTFLFDSNHRKLKLFGEFNQKNASGAFKAAELLGLSPNFINKVLSDFNGVDGRTTSINFNDSKIIIGKTDNPDAAAAVFNEGKMDIIIIGTPRKNEEYRFSILKEVKNANPKFVALFPGLDNTTEKAMEILRTEGYNGEICLLNEVSDVVNLALKCVKNYKTVFIGGNGQKKILSIQKDLNKISKSINNY